MLFCCSLCVFLISFVFISFCLFFILFLSFFLFLFLSFLDSIMSLFVSCLYVWCLLFDAFDLPSSCYFLYFLNSSLFGRLRPCVVVSLPVKCSNACS